MSCLSIMWKIERPLLVILWYSDIVIIFYILLRIWLVCSKRIINPKTMVTLIWLAIVVFFLCYYLSRTNGSKENGQHKFGFELTHGCARTDHFFFFIVCVHILGFQKCFVPSISFNVKRHHKISMSCAREKSRFGIRLLQWRAIK